MVVISMDYVLNSEYKELYDSVFVVNNPNNCPIRGTFFIQVKLDYLSSGPPVDFICLVVRVTLFHVVFPHVVIMSTDLLYGEIINFML